MRPWTCPRCLPALALFILIACSREPAISDDAYRQAVTAFYTGLAAMQTSQDVLARRELERVTELAPREAAARANDGLLLLRQQQIDEVFQDAWNTAVILGGDDVEAVAGQYRIGEPGERRRFVRVD